MVAVFPPFTFQEPEIKAMAYLLYILYVIYASSYNFMGNCFYTSLPE